MSPPHRLDRHAALYRRLLGVYPAAYRREVGEVAVATFRDLAGSASRERGARGVACLWAVTLPRVVLGGLGERVAALRDVRWDATETPDAAPPYGWALLAGSAVLALYVVTLAPTTAFWDTSEYIATAHIMGIPHPPGNPLFVVLARTWELLLAPLGLSVAVRINLFSAFMSAAAHGLWFLVVHRILAAFDARRAFRLVGAAAAVLVSATAFTVWSQSNVNEKVYTVSLLTIALLSWLALRWQERPEGARGAKLLVLMAFVLGLSVGNHLMAFLAGPAIVVFIALVRPRTLLRWRLYPALLVAGMAGLTIHLFLPIRAELDPVINQGAPECPSIESALGSVLSYGRAGCERLSASLNREQYQKPPVQERQAPLRAQLVNYIQYFDWQWARAVDGTRTLFAGARLPFTMLFTGLGLWGALEHHRRDRRTFTYMLVLFGTLSLALVLYMNFEHGYSFPGPADVAVEREVRERDYFFIVSFSLWGLWAGVGIAALWLGLARRASRGLLRASPVLLVACIPLALNASWANRSYDYAARDWAYNVLQSVEPYGVLFTSGDNDTFPLWYLQEVEGIRRDVTVVVTSYLDVPWYAKQLRDLTRPCQGDGRGDGEHGHRHAAAEPFDGLERAGGGGREDGGRRDDATSDAAPAPDPTRIHCQRDYVPDAHVAYAGAGDPVPAGAVPLVMIRPPARPKLPIMQLDDETIDRVGRSYYYVENPLALRLGEITPVLPAEQTLTPWHQYALAIVDTAFADSRPVYWANAGPDPASLGLEGYLVRQGVAFKLHNGSLHEDPPEGVEALVAEPEILRGTGTWLDVPRTAALVDEVFIHRSNLPKWGHWPDHSTTIIPYFYAWSNYALAIAAENRGDERAASRYARDGQDWMQLAM